MWIAANLPADLWPEIVKAAGYISNRTPVQKLGWKTPFEAVTKTKPQFAHLHVYGCRAYPLIQKIPRRAKLDSRAHIGHLVGYDSTNIFRIWIPSRNKVIRTRDVTFKDDLVYDPAELDIGILLREEVEETIVSLDIPEIPSHTQNNENQFLELESGPEISENASENSMLTPQSGEASASDLPRKRLLPTPSPTPEAAPSNPTQASEGGIPEQTIIVQPPESPEQTIIVQPPVETGDTIVVQPPTTRGSRSTGNKVPKRGLNSSDLQDRFILPGRTRSSAHVVTLQQNGALAGYYSAFSTIWKSAKPKGLHRDNFPPCPKSWKQILKHPYNQEFLQAAEKEYRSIESKETFEYIAENDSRVQEYSQKPLPLMWTLVYKFDENGFLDKFKARLVARRDLQSTEEDTYAATLAAQVFRAVMAITAAFDLETQ